MSEQPQKPNTAQKRSAYSNWNWILISFFLIATSALAAVTTPQIQPNGVVNSANFQGPVTPGEIVSVFGSNFTAGSATAQASMIPLPTYLGGVSVTVGGVSAPLIFVSATLVNLQIPYEVTSGTSVNVVVTANGISSAPVTVQVVNYGVAVFTYSRTPSVLDPVILHLSNELVTPTNPANPNEILIIYGTGIGNLSPVPGTGQAAPANPPAAAVDTPTITLGGVPVQVLFAGLTPGLAGLAQINIQLPATLPAGYRLPLVIQFPNDSSTPVSLAVAGDGGTGPALTLSATSLAYGNVTVGQTTSLPETVSNNGNVPLVINSTALSGSGFTLAGESSVSLDAGGAETLNVNYTPAAAVASQGTLTILSNDPNSPTLVPLTGTGATPPAISTSPPSLTFGAIQLGQTGSISLGINNTGNSELIVKSFSSSNPRFALALASAPISVDPGTSKTITVNFTPTIAGAESGGLTIASTDPSTPALTLNMTGNGVSSGASPAISVTPSSLSFGSVSTGLTKDLSVTIANNGGGTLTVNSITSSNAAFATVATSTPFSVAPGAFQYVTIRFSASSAGAQSGSITIANNSGSNATVSLSGTGVAPSVSPIINVNPSNLNFGIVTTGQSTSLTMTVYNTGSGPLTVNSITSSNAAFSFSGISTPFTVAAGGSQPVAVQFAPTLPGPQLATFKIASTDPVTPSYAVFLTATGVGPPLVPSITVAPTTLTFGSVATGQTAGLILAIGNTGNTVLNVSSVTSSNPVFSLQGISTPFSVSAGTSQLVNIQFAPTASGTQTGTLTVASNDPNNPSVTVTVSGTGTGVALTPTINVNTTSLNFGTVTSGQTSDLDVTISNSGTGALTVSAITSTNPVFTIVSPSVPFTVAAGQSQGVDVRFSPTSSTAVAGTITISSNDPVNPNIGVSLSGNTGGGGSTGNTITLKVDGGSFDAEIGYPAGTPTAYFVNRLTPPSYPATIQSVEIYFTNRPDALPLNTPITIISAQNPAGASLLQFGAVPDQVPATVTAYGTFINYPVPNRTITEGDFVIGFEVNNAASILPADLDQLTPSQMRSYASSDGVGFTLIDSFGSAVAGNLSIRAVVTVPTQ